MQKLASQEDMRLLSMNMNEICTVSTYNFTLFRVKLSEIFETFDDLTIWWKKIATIRLAQLVLIANRNGRRACSKCVWDKLTEITLFLFFKLNYIWSHGRPFHNGNIIEIVSV